MAIGKILQNPNTISFIPAVDTVTLTEPTGVASGYRVLIADDHRGTVQDVDNVLSATWAPNLGKIVVSDGSGGWEVEDYTLYMASQIIIVKDININYSWYWLQDQQSFLSNYSPANLLTKNESTNVWYQKNPDGTLDALFAGKLQPPAHIRTEYLKTSIRTSNLGQRTKLSAGGFVSTPIVDNASMIPNSTTRKIDFDVTDGSFTVNVSSIFFVEFQPYIYVQYDKNSIDADLVASGLPSYTEDHINGDILLTNASTGDEKLLYDAGWKNYPAVSIRPIICHDARANGGGRNYYPGIQNVVNIYQNKRILKNSVHVPMVINTVLALEKGDKVYCEYDWVQAGNSGNLKMIFISQTSRDTYCTITELGDVAANLDR